VVLYTRGLQDSPHIPTPLCRAKSFLGHEFYQGPSFSFHATSGPPSKSQASRGREGLGRGEGEVPESTVLLRGSANQADHRPLAGRGEGMLGQHPHPLAAVTLHHRLGLHLREHGARPLARLLAHLCPPEPQSAPPGHRFTTPASTLARRHYARGTQLQPVPCPGLHLAQPRQPFTTPARTLACFQYAHGTQSSRLQPVPCPGPHSAPPSQPFTTPSAPLPSASLSTPTSMTSRTGPLALHLSRKRPRAPPRHECNPRSHFPSAFLHNSCCAGAPPPCDDRLLPFAWPALLTLCEVAYSHP
jgi:hypothetical protein